MKRDFDFVICGAGCSGLSLAIRLASPEFAKYKILILDKDAKKSNDRTWSFWSKETDAYFSEIYTKTWTKLGFYSSGLELVDSPHPYTYNTIRGIDFYTYCFEKLKEADHIVFRQERIEEVQDKDDHVLVSTESGEYTCNYAFDSIVKRFPIETKLFVWQHFLGWEIELTDGSFDVSTATFMDFRIDQKGETRFVYVLPFTEKKALVEATLFSKELCDAEEYESMLESYLEKYLPHPYKVCDREVGKIPMTTTSFSKGSPRVIPIGTNNSIVKPSSGYAFTRIQKEADKLVKYIKEEKVRRVKANPRFLAYDKTLLNVLITEKESGAHVFTEMFKHNKMSSNLNFLDETSSIWQEMRIFSTLPFWSFLKAFLQENVFRITKK